MRMPWGKYKGTTIEDVPLSYLCFVVEEDYVVPESALGKAIVEEISDRLQLKVRVDSGGVDRSLIISIYRRLSLMFHPDRGGNTDAQKAINLFYEQLMETYK